MNRSRRWRGTQYGTPGPPTSHGRSPGPPVRRFTSRPAGVNPPSSSLSTCRRCPGVPPPPSGPSGRVRRSSTGPWTLTVGLGSGVGGRVESVSPSSSPSRSVVPSLCATYGAGTHDVTQWTSPTPRRGVGPTSGANCRQGRRPSDPPRGPWPLTRDHREDRGFPSGPSVSRLGSDGRPGALGTLCPTYLRPTSPRRHPWFFRYW